MDVQLVKNTSPESNYIIHPKKFTLWLLIVGLSMIFAALTSAYIVRRAEGNWDVFPLPMQFMYTVAIAVVSSITMQWAYYAAKHDELNQVKIAVGATLLLGIAFCAGQWMGWTEMTRNGLTFTGVNNPTQDYVEKTGMAFTGKQNPATTFVYTISLIHLLHVLGGIIFLVVVLAQSFKLKIHRKNLLSISMCKTYWHFVGLLWIYLYLFLFLNR